MNDLHGIRRTLFLALGILLPGLTACDAFSQGVEANRDVLARAEGVELTVQEAAELLSNQQQLPNQPEVVEALADLWIDYTLLTLAVNEDPGLGHLDLTPVVRREMEQMAVFALRDSVIRPDTALTEEELRSLFEEELPGGRVRARHILLTYPDQATEEQRDSVLELARDLRARVEEGAAFDSLARERSDDPGSARRGGDLGFFGRGEMVEPFSDAAFAAEPGELVGPVESPYGVHVIRVEDREVPDFEAERSNFRARVVNRRVFSAESTYVASLEEPAEVTIPDDAYDAAREIARRPQRRLTSRAGQRALANYQGGKLTALEFREYVQGRPPAFRNQVMRGEDQQIEVLLRGLTRAELLVNAATEEGFAAGEAQRDSLLAQARDRVVQAARTTGLANIEPQEGESPAQAADRVVMAQLGRILAGDEDVLPLGSMGLVLRQTYSAEVFEPAVQRVLDAVGTRPGPGQAQPRPTGPVERPSGPQRAPNAPPPDTTG